MIDNSGAIQAPSEEQIYQEHLSVVHEVAAQYWQQKKDQVTHVLHSIEVIKRTGGKIMGFFPRYADFPPVFFKVYFYDRGFQFEVDGLMAANSMPQVAGIRVPTIVSILPEKKAILTEKRAWQDSSSELRRFFVRSLKIDWGRVGLWLRNYHDSKVSLSKNEYFIRKKLQKIQTHLEKLRHLFTGEQQEKMNMIIRSSQDYLNTHACDWVISHGDFGLDNIKISDSTMDIIDFEDSQMAPRDFDILNFLTRLEYTGYFSHKKRTYIRICRDFLNGYGLKLPVTPIYNFFYLLIKLDMIETYYRRRRNTTSKIIQKNIYFYFEKEGLRRLNRWLHIIN